MTGGRRERGKMPRGLVENRFGLLSLVLVSLGALYGVAHVTRPAPVPTPDPRPSRAAIESVTTVCPGPSGATLSVVATGGKGQGTATVTEIGKAEPSATVDEPGRLWRKDGGKGDTPLLVAAEGAMATGLETALTQTVTSGERRGLAGVRCTEPTSHTWLIGPGPATADVTLHLANADGAPASVAISIYAGEGTVLRDHGFVVEPGEHRAIPLKDLAPSPLVMAVEVRTTTGRVAVAARAALGGDRGVDWLPLAAAPATTVVVPGIPGGGGQRELYVAAPGDSDALVEVKAVTADGSYALRNRETLQVPAGSVATLDLTTGIGGQEAAMVLTSPVPIVAGMVVTSTGTRQDVAFTAGTGPIDLGSVVAENRMDGGKKPDRSSVLVLSAPQRAGKVRITVLPAEGSAPDPMDVTVPAARTRRVRLPAVKGSFGVAVAPLPGSGPVYGGRVLGVQTDSGLLLTLQPLSQARTWTLVPPLTDSPATVLP